MSESTAFRTGAEMIAVERSRQIESEGWSLRHDRSHDGEQLARAAIALLFRYIPVTAPTKWMPEDWTISTSTSMDCLVKAGALIAAEIDRIQRHG